MSENIKINSLKDKELLEVSKKMLLSLNLQEMNTIQKYFADRDREPTDMEMEIIAQTWSEHCKHKTMTGIIEYKEIYPDGSMKEEKINNLLKETVFRATEEMKKEHCLSVFEDNAGIIDFDGVNGIAMKVETHNHPSALEPYGGASTGIGGVIRDVLGCGKGARPVANIDVFCFGMPDTSVDEVPEGVLHPKRVYKGVVEGVRDYGNRMGIPTLSGAVIFGNEYMYNPLVYCGTVGIIPKKHIEKEVKPGDLIVAVGGGTGRDGIHGATFSSIGLDEEADVGCVQIGDPVTEKKFTDALITLRDMELYNAVTDCGAGGFSSAVGEMGEKTGAKVYLDQVPLKYAGLKPWEIFLSESQERMVLSVPPQNFDVIKNLLEKEDVQVSVIGEFTDTGKLEVFYEEKREAELEMDFIHNGVPDIKRKAVWVKKEFGKIVPDVKRFPDVRLLFNNTISHINVASKAAIIRQYDHEVQGGAVLKPLGGPGQDAPQDGCVIDPVFDSGRGIAIGLGINPFYGMEDAYSMALSNCEEAARNTVIAGGNIEKAGFMDNFCWGDTDEEEILGSLVRASQGCYKASRELQIPFVSGKDSLNNFYMMRNMEQEVKVNIPGTLLITCVAPVDDIKKVTGSDFKGAGNIVYLIGNTYPEFGGSVIYNMAGIRGGKPPGVDLKLSYNTLKIIRKCIEKEVLRSCHDLSDGGLAAGIAEMCFSGIGTEIDISEIVDGSGFKMNMAEKVITGLFSESNSRFLAEVEQNKGAQFEELVEGIPYFRIGCTSGECRLKINYGSDAVIDQLKNT